jgi:hypothetical protein
MSPGQPLARPPENPPPEGKQPPTLAGLMTTLLAATIPAPVRGPVAVAHCPGVSADAGTLTSRTTLVRRLTLKRCGPAPALTE